MTTLDNFRAEVRGGFARALTATLVAAGVAAGALGCSPRDQVVAFRVDAAPLPPGPSDRFGVPTAMALLDAGDLVQDPSLTADELEIYFATTKAGALDVWVATRTAIDRPWDLPRRVDELSTPDLDLEPDVSPDGLALHLVSDRPSQSAGFRIWSTRRQQRGDLWDPPQPLLLGASTMERGPTVDATRRLLVFATDRTGGDFDLYESMRASDSTPWGTPAALTDVNTIWYDWDPALFMNGLALVFGSRRQGDHASSDLFQTIRPSASSPFAAAEPLTELNTPQAEGDPWLSNDGHHVVFTSERTGIPRLYEARR